MSCSPGESLTKTTIVLRNGMDFEPKKTYPPDYSNVPSVRDWQMSPFSNERYDLDELQKAKKRGFKGRFELERLKKLYPVLAAEVLEGGIEPEAVKCDEGEKKEKLKEKVDCCRPENVKCSWELLYQPYGPNTVSTMDCCKPPPNRPKMYNILGPSSYNMYRFRIPAPDTYYPIPCQDYGGLCRSEGEHRGYYVPFGPYEDWRVAPGVYSALGPPSLRTC